MKRLACIVVTTLLLPGCVALAPQPPADPFADWLVFAARIEGLDAERLGAEHELLLARFEENPSDEDRIRLAYLLSRPDSPAHDLGESQALLAAVSESADYAPIRDLVAREVALGVELESAAIRVEAVQARVDELQTRLDALKAIEADLSADHRQIEGQIEELPE